MVAVGRIHQHRGVLSPAACLLPGVELKHLKNLKMSLKGVTPIPIKIATAFPLNLSFPQSQNATHLQLP